MLHDSRLAVVVGALFVSCASAFLVPALAHEDDPKWQGREESFKGPIYRAGQSDGGIAGTFESNGMSLLSWFPLNTLSAGATSGNDCWGYTTPTGREIAMIGLSNGTAFVNVTNPTQAYQIGFVAGPTSLWRDIKVYDKYAYIVSEGGSGVQVVSLISADSGVVGLVNTVTVGGVASTHNVALNTNSGFLYRCGGASNTGLRIYDLNQSKTAPPFVGEWSDRYVHDAQVVNYTTGPYAGKEVAFCCAGFNNGSGSTGLYIVDVTNKAAPVLMGSLLYPNAAYSHQGWLSEDRTLFYLGDELDEGSTVANSTVVVINVTDLANPTFVASRNNGNTAITHNFYTDNGMLYCANYRSGVRIFEPAAGGNLIERAWFDTYPGSDAASFNGLWSVYPYFQSGIVIGSDLERGLFVWRVGPEPIQFSFPEPLPELIPPSGTSINVNLELQPGVIVVPSSERLLVTINGVETSYPMQQLGATSYRANVPAQACGTEGGLAFRAQEGGGEVFRFPDVGSVDVVWATGTAVGYENTLESGSAGWTIGGTGDAATSGVWVLVNPNGTAAQPEDDHTANGTQCFVTGQGSIGGAVGTDDVDGGQTTLTSPAMDATIVSNPILSFWYAFNNSGGSNPGEDPFTVDLSGNNGSTWTNALTTLVTTAGWTEHRVDIASVMTPTATMKLRFRTTDAGVGGSIVEAAIDDLSIIGFECEEPSIPGDVNGDGIVDGQDLAGLLGAWGSSLPAADFNGDGVVDGVDLASLVANWG
ncbi:MAG: choice-of-anchor B family protein [Planctomycetota bacterium]|nr:choice-of-anchor B family protein [Planctomycetota bacterium]MDA1105726.1 choice-of-anchor B family protein [Planctomycetota bacterium]